MKIWFLADTHFGMHSDDENTLMDCYNYFKTSLIPYMKQNVKDDDILVHLGDVYDNRTSIGIKTFYYSFLIFQELGEIFNDIRIIVGNHDMAMKNSTQITMIHSLKNINTVRVYFIPVYENICNKKVLFVPWIEDLNEQKRIVKESDADYIFGHLQIGGCVSNVRKKIILNNDNMVQISDFKKSQVYAGHIHIRQDLKNVHYVGIPYHKDYGDVGNKTGITILDIETGKTEFIENTYSPIYMCENIYDILNDTIGDVRKRWTNNHIEIEIKASDYANHALDELREILNNCYKGWDIKQIDSETIIDVDEKLVLNETKSSSDKLYEYIDVACSDTDEKIKERVKEYFKSKIENI